jgi:ribonuclease BN (tRNA processing enzyme)
LRDRLERLVRVSYGSLADREPGFPIAWGELAPGEGVDVGGLLVQAFRADHVDPPEVPLCLRIVSADGRAVAFSGDTRICDGLKEAARGVDLLVAECTHFAPPAGGHSTWQEWRELLPRIGARRVLLTHLADEVRAKVPELRRAAPEGVEVEFAEDGMVLEV